MHNINRRSRSFGSHGIASFGIASFYGGQNMEDLEDIAWRPRQTLPLNPPLNPSPNPPLNPPNQQRSLLVVTVVEYAARFPGCN